MDSESIIERAEVMHQPAELLPGTDDGPKWVATDPETECQGVGEFEEEARTNLVHAVEAYRQEREHTAPFVSFGREKTYEMRWRRDTTLVDRFRSLLPF